MKSPASGTWHGAHMWPQAGWNSTKPQSGEAGDAEPSAWPWLCCSSLPLPRAPAEQNLPDKVLALIPTGTAHLGWLRGRRRHPRAARSPGTPGRKGSAISSDPGQQGHRALITTTISSLMAHSVPALLGRGMGWGTQQETGTKARDKDHSRSLVPAAASPEAEVPPDPAG